MTRKEKLKVYHGVPKSITDKHTIFYLKDSSVIGNVQKQYNTPTGETGFTNYTSKPILSGFRIPYEEFTIDFWIDSTKYVSSTDSVIVGLVDNKNNRVLFVEHTANLGGKLYFTHTSSQNQFGGEAVNSGIALSKLHHIRCVKNKNTICMYVDGVLKNKKTLNYKWVSENSLNLVLFGNSNSTNTLINLYNLKGDVVSDLHISNIDRGDCFPNLPQDFIDGKAIIKPRMGQQQIKGDPIYCQETTNVIKIGANINESYIACNRTSGNWANGDAIKIKGLNGEVISGVVDSDTALAKVKRVINSKQIFVLDSVQKLSVNDVVRFNVGNSYSPEATISKIESDTNTITLSTPLSGWEVAEEYCLVETTASSSSPIVKSSDGTVVTGTWSNLGTNEATFTLGTNSSLTNQDLYITYSLNIPGGNSDFSELPYSVEKVYDEACNELIKLDTICVMDDFKNKVTGSIVECPHSIYRSCASSLLKPSVIGTNVGINFVECSDSVISSIQNDDDKFAHMIASGNGQYSQILLSFDLISIVERKIGKIPAQNKVEWLKNNVYELYLKIGAKGSCPSGNYMRLSIFNTSDSSWVTGYTNTTSSMSLIHVGTANVNAPNRIDNNGKVHYLCYSNASDGSVSSSVSLNYTYFEIQLKKDADFDIYFTDNKRAREMPCNPVLIQKETKTVKRYLPSKECFVTEIRYSKPPIYPDIAQYNKVGRKMSSHGRYFLSSVGTGTRQKSFDGNLNQMPYKKFLYKYSGESIIEIPYTVFTSKSDANDYNNIFTLIEFMGSSKSNFLQSLVSVKHDENWYKSEQGANRGIKSIADYIKDNYNYYGIACNLISYKNELCLIVSNCSPDFNASFNNIEDKLLSSSIYTLPNRPLIK